MPSLEVQDLQVKYGLLTAVHGIDLTVEPGEIVVVLGSNGAGKTSTLNAISGRVKVAAGAIRLDGQDVTGWAAHRVSRAGLVQVPEGRRIFAPLSIEENLVLGGYAQSRARRKELLEETYELFPILRERREGAAGLLSGGEHRCSPSDGR
jgi:branched-chain amino acid transport system ATP-binding protein